jgi:NADH:ubiquinone oxidoreductase subunit 3 (subunit A)
MPVFEILLFPWAASGRAIRTNSFASIVLSMALLVALLWGKR